jgi:hypothetical protein
MRRLLVTSVVLLATVALSAGCASRGGPSAPSWTTKPAAADNGPGSAIVVCGSIRTAVTADMGPIGTAFGAMVGRATADDDDDVAKARAQAVTALKKLGADISAAAAAATDAPLRDAGKTAETNIQALAADSSFLSGITSMEALQDATAKLQQAIEPLTSACARS